MKVEFIYVSPTFGETVLSATTWPEVISELHERGIVNVGKVKVIKRSYRWISDEPQIINTDSMRRQDEKQSREGEKQSREGEKQSREGEKHSPHVELQYLSQRQSLFLEPVAN